ncbi:MAG: DUF559 domain-containing protein [Candidatus Nanoarchaeia archaeon]|nr:DUF559 domain-containing protein [Candidatus Nanoarchaeia archaeon]
MFPESSQSKTEIKFMKVLKSVGLTPKVQHRFEAMTLDFAFPEEKLAVEIDGPTHETSYQRYIDRRRDLVLLNRGWRVIRYNSEQIHSNPEKYALEIKQELEKIRKDQHYDKKPYSRPAFFD